MPAQSRHLLLCSTLYSLRTPLYFSAFGRKMAGTGFEPLADSTGKTSYPPLDGAESGALRAQAQIDAGLVAVIEAWPSLPEGIKAGILAIVRTSQ
jgi:hypothetical protein